MGIFIIPLLLFIPVLHYSLPTPIGLIDNAPGLARKFDDASAFLHYLHNTFVDSGQERFRPFYDVWIGLIWKVFGDAPWPHHLSQWMFHFGAAALFIAAFRRVSTPPLPPNANASSSRTGMPLRAIPVALLACLWLFFPNVPAVRVQPQEVYTVFFLGLCNWAVALMLTTDRGWSAPRHHALFCMGYLGLVFCKEVNVAAALFLLAFWWALAIAKGVSAKKTLVGAALALTLFVAIHRISLSLEMAAIGSRYFASTSSILDRLHENAPKILRGLFQYETSAAVTAVFAFLLISLITAVGARMPRRKIDGELAFILLLLGELISMFLILSLSYGVSLRYWYILVPCLAMLLAFAAKLLLEAAQRHRVLANCTALALAIFIAFFVSANYYNFLHQTLTAHSARNLDARLIAEVAQLLNSGQYVQGSTDDWSFEEMKILGQQMHWPKSPYGAHSIHRVPPQDPQQPYYILDMLGNPDLMDTHASLVGRTDYGILNHAGKVAGLLQGKTPHLSKDYGMFALGEYRWTLYALPHNMSDYVDQLTAAAGEAIAQSIFDVHLDGGRILYAKKPCVEEDVGKRFFLHLLPARTTDLPESRRPHGFDNLDFHFRDYGIRNGGACFAVRTLPQYAITKITTGQYVSGKGPVWRAKIPVEI